VRIFIHRTVVNRSVAEQFSRQEVASWEGASTLKYLSDVKAFALMVQNAQTSGVSVDLHFFE
jgi:hypothetical protein